jgi:hypothetical protein
MDKFKYSPMIYSKIGLLSKRFKLIPHIGMRVIYKISVAFEA